MSIQRCPHCDTEYDSDFNAEHEDVCKEERKTQYLDVMEVKEDGVIVLQNRETYEVIEMRGDKKIKSYFPREDV